MNLILNELRKVKLQDGTPLSDVAVLSPSLVDIGFESEDGRMISFTVTPLNESFIQIEIQLVDKRKNYRQVVAFTNNPAYFIETVKEFARSSRIKRRRLRVKGNSLEIEMQSIIVPSLVFDKWVTAVANKDSIIVFDVSFIEDEEGSIIVKENVEVLKEIMSLAPFDIVFKVLEEIVADTSNVKRRVVKPFKCGSGFCVAIGIPESEEYRRYHVPVENERKHVILLIPENGD